jgi:hypothetical protein
MGTRRWLSFVAPLIFGAISAYLVVVGLMLVGDEIPRREITLEGHLVARVYERGWGGNDFDEVKVVQQPRWLPLAERTIYDRSVPYLQCKDVTARIASTSAGKSVEIVCEQSVYDNVHIP